MQSAPDDATREPDRPVEPRQSSTPSGVCDIRLAACFPRPIGRRQIPVLVQYHLTRYTVLSRVFCKVDRRKGVLRELASEPPRCRAFANHTCSLARGPSCIANPSHWTPSPPSGSVPAYHHRIRPRVWRTAAQDAEISTGTQGLQAVRTPFLLVMWLHRVANVLASRVQGDDACGLANTIWGTIIQPRYTLWVDARGLWLSLLAE